MLNSPLGLIVMLAVAAAAVSMTVAKSGIFRGLRVWVTKKSKFFGELMYCPYCISHWVSFGLVAIYRPRLFLSAIALLDYFLAAMVMVGLSALFAGLIFRAFLGYKPAQDDD